jgi:mannan endo-1,4-beta-mannosidase
MLLRWAGCISILGVICSPLSAAAQEKPIRLLAESAKLKGAVLDTARPGYTGKGYLTAFKNNGDNATFTFTCPKAGLYGVQIRYCSPSGVKGYDLAVNNNLTLHGAFAGTGQVFAMHQAGKVDLTEGDNTLTLNKGWGYYDIDYIELTAVPPASPPKSLSRTLSDPAATPEALALWGRLVDSYGKRTLSGVYSTDDGEYVRQTTGAIPALMGGDLMDYSPSRVAYGTRPDGTVEALIEQARRGHILTVSWHWNAPKDLIDKQIKDIWGHTVDAQWYKGFYANATTFDVAKAMADPDSEEYRLILRDIDAIAAELRKLSDAKVPVLWRPLHEADGRWFWWGAKGPEPLVKLWRLMHQRLTEHHGLHNLIWVYTGSAEWRDMQWYPGDAYVDVVAMDLYPQDTRDPYSATWDYLLPLFDGKKLLAIGEFGGVPDVARMRRFGAYWAYFVSWTGPAGPRKLSQSDLRRIYTDPAVVNRDEARH